MILSYHMYDQAEEALSEETLHPGWRGWNGRVARGIASYAAPVSVLWALGAGWTAALIAAAPIAVGVFYRIRNNHPSVASRPLWEGIGRLVAWCAAGVLSPILIMWPHESWDSPVRWDVAFGVGISIGFVFCYAERRRGPIPRPPSEWLGWNGRLAYAIGSYAVGICNTFGLAAYGPFGWDIVAGLAVPVAIGFYILIRVRHPIVLAALLAIVLSTFVVVDL